MSNEIRFGTFVRVATLRQDIISFNDLVGVDAVRRGDRIRLRPIDAYRLFSPYA